MDIQYCECSVVIGVQEEYDKFIGDKCNGCNTEIKTVTVEGVPDPIVSIMYNKNGIAHNSPNMIPSLLATTVAYLDVILSEMEESPKH